MYPNLFVIGAAKSGTSALHLYLSLHPEIHMSEPKEPHFFSRSPDELWPGGKPLSDSQYQRLFDSPLQIRGESSVTYSFHPHPAGVPDRIQAVAPDAKFLYVVRDPIERYLSHYRMRVGHGTERRSLADVVFDPRNTEELRYTLASNYATQAEQYIERFGDDCLLVLDHIDLLQQRSAVMREAFEFLGVDPHFSTERFDTLVNSGTELRRFSQVGSRLSKSAAYQRGSAWIRPDIRRKLVRPVRSMLSRPVPHPEVPGEIREALAARFAPEAERLRRITGGKFATWSV